MSQAEDVGGAEGAASDDLRQSKVAVLFPVPVGRQVGQYTEAHLALSQRVYHLLPQQKSAELAADGMQRMEHPVIRFAHLPAGESEDADYLVLRCDRKDAGAVLAGFGRESRRG